MKRYVVQLTPAERADREALTRKGTCRARTVKRALVLLAAADGRTDAVIAAQVRVSTATAERLRRRCVAAGVAAAVADRPRPGKARKLDGRQEAHLLALACTEPPAGRQSWTMQLLADKLVEQQLVEAISDETVRRVLKKGTSNRGK
jgi:transposase